MGFLAIGLYLCDTCQYDNWDSLVPRSNNPLADWDEERLQRHMKEFIESKDLEDYIPVKLYKNAARLAKDPMYYTKLRRGDQREALELEMNSRWKQSKALYTTIAVCSVSAMVQVRLTPTNRFIMTAKVDCHRG